MRVAWATQQDPVPPDSEEAETDRRQKTTSLRKEQGKVLETSRPCHRTQRKEMEQREGSKAIFRGLQRRILPSQLEGTEHATG